MSTSSDILERFFDLVVDPLVTLLFAAAVLYFVYGIFTYIRNADDSGERVTGGKHILWSTVGLFIMVSVWGIIKILDNTFN